MKVGKVISATAVAVLLTASGNGECASANLRVEVNIETGQSTPAHLVKKSVGEYASTAEGIYTGLVIDCRGLGLKTAMSPVILNANGTKIYGHKNIDPDKVIEMGMADYVNDPAKLSRAGSNPLIIKAIALENFNSNPVVSLEDSNQIIIENYATQFLKALKVVFLYD